MGRGKNGIEFTTTTTTMILGILTKVQNMRDLSWVGLNCIHILAEEEQAALLAMQVYTTSHFSHFISAVTTNCTGNLD